MRLIDADVLIAKQASIAKTFARSDAQKSLIGRVMYNTEKAPTVDAIPVGWLFDWRNRALKEGMNPELVEWIGYILQIWSREREAR